MRPVLHSACTDQGKQRKTAATHQMLMSAGWTGRKTEDNPQAVRNIASFSNGTDLQLNQHATHLDSSSSIVRVTTQRSSGTYPVA